MMDGCGNMLDLDLDEFEERAAIIEYEGGVSRFEAETLASKAQGYSRHEVMHEIRKRDSEKARHSGSAGIGHSASNVPGVQLAPKEKTGFMPQRDVQAGRVGLDMLALRMERG